MSNLTIYRHNEPAKVIFQSADFKAIQTELNKAGVLFEQWQANAEIAAESTQEDIISAYADDIARVQQDGGYQTVDVISLTKGNPNAAELRQKFLFEHTHSEDEVRFFVKGQGLFCLHLNERVYQVLCQQGDLISVPANTQHWFDMGSDPEFTAIRFFNNEAGWVAQSTDSDIATQFPILD